MHVVVNHTINDTAKWNEGSQRIMSMIEQHRLPKDLKPLEYLPSVDGHRAVCVWETKSLNSLRDFMDRETTGAAKNDYFEIKVQDSIGLPKGEETPLAKAA